MLFPKKHMNFPTKPSEAIALAVKGLREMPKEGEFEIDMDTFGSREGAVCVGCAATCAIMEIYGREDVLRMLRERYGRTPGQILNNYGGFNFNSFEDAISQARIGYLGQLFTFFGLEISGGLDKDQDINLSSEDWQEELPKFEALGLRLAAMGY